MAPGVKLLNLNLQGQNLKLFEKKNLEHFWSITELHPNYGLETGFSKLTLLKICEKSFNLKVT